MSQMQNALRWGDIVRIHGVNLSKDKQQESLGLIVSKGFTDCNIYYQKYDNFDQVNFYRESLFQVMPHSNFDIHDQLNDPTISAAHKQNLRSKAKGQIQSMQNGLALKIGESVVYGSQVIFRHVESNSYLRGLLKASDTGDGAFTIQVSAQPSSQIIWKIDSHRSYQHDGDYIYFDDQLLIYHVSTDCFMNFAEGGEPISIDRKIQLKNNIHSRPTIKRPVGNRVGIINENKSKCLWKFIEHCNYEKYTSSTKIKSHDIVYFKHTKNQGYLASSLISKQFYIKETVDHKITFDSFWELIPNQVNQLGPEKCNDFSVRNVVTGQYFEYNNFRIKVTSQEQVQGGGFYNQGLINLIYSDVQSVDDIQGRKIERGQKIEKDTTKPSIVQTAQNLYQLYQLKDVQALTEDSFQILLADQSTIRSLQYVLSAHEHLVHFLDTIIQFLQSQKQQKQKKFQEQKIQYQFKQPLVLSQLENIRKVLEMLSGKIYGTNFAQIVSSGNTPNPLIQKIIVQTGTTELLIEIIDQLYKPFKFCQENTGQPTSDKVFRDRIQQLWQRAYQLLQKIVVGNQRNKFYLSRWVDLFLEHSNNINRQFIQQCLVGILQNNPTAIQATINQAKIQNLIRCFYAQAKKNRSGEELTTKYLRLFSTFIKCDQRILRQNQNIILDKFFKDKDNFYCYRFKVQGKEDMTEVANDPITKVTTKRLEIALHKQDFCPVPKYFKDWGLKWNYFVHFVNLLADVCMDQNVNAIQNVSALVSLQIVTVVLLDSDIDKLNQDIRQANIESIKQKGFPKYPLADVREPFVRIAHHVYISNSKFTPIKTIRNISSWYKLQQKGGKPLEVNKTKRAFQGQKDQQQKFYLGCILKYLQKYLGECDQRPASLDLLYTNLILLKQTVLLGLWDSITQYRKLIPRLIMRVAKIQNQQIFYKELQSKKTPYQIVKANKEAFSFNRPEISLNIYCKITTTQIFKSINQLQIDIRLRYLMNYFKGLYEATQNFEQYNHPLKQPEITDTYDQERNLIAKEEFQKSQFSSLLGKVEKVSEDQDVMLKQNMWCNKFKQITPSQGGALDRLDRYLFKGSGEDKPDFQSMVLALLQLPLYKNQKLLGSTLRMLRLVFEQRKDLISQFNQLLVCGRGNLMQVYTTLRFMREKFYMLINPNVLKLERSSQQTNLVYSIDKPYDSMQKSPAQRSGILQDLFFLSRTLKEDINLKNIESLMYVQRSAFDPRIVYQYLTQKQKNNSLFQKVNIAQGIYVPLIKYIKLIGPDPNPYHKNLLFAIYHYLSLLCFNNLEAKQKLSPYILDILPHLGLHVGASNFLYHLTVNNKNLIANPNIVASIIEGALQACIRLQNQEKYSLQNDKDPLISYQKSQIIFSLRGILLLNNEGFRINQEALMNKFQDNKYKKLIYKGRVQFMSSRKDDFLLTPEQSYVVTFFQLFSVLVETKNFINVGKLQNIHPYSYCLDCMKNTNRWQLRRSIRAYINRLYYVNKQRDVFLFQQFIRRDFRLLNDQLDEIIRLYRQKLINEKTIIPNGIRFKFALSQILQMLVQIFVTLEEMLLKPEFVKVLKKQIQKQEKKSENQREVHEQLIKLLHNLGCINLLYPTKNIIHSFVIQIKNNLTNILLCFSQTYLEAQTKQEIDIPQTDQRDDLEEVDKKNYVYDHSKSFFRNLASMIRDIKAKEKKQKMRQKLALRQNGSGKPQDLKIISIDLIFECQGQNLKAVTAKKARQAPGLFKPHLQTTSSRLFKVIAKPTLSQNQQNIQLNKRLGLVKNIIQDSSLFKKLKQDQFYQLVTTLTNIDATSKVYYQQNWLAIEEKKSIPVMSLREIFKQSFKLLMNQPSTICVEEKIFLIKIARCYITEAIESTQNYKLSVDVWDADYFPGSVPSQGLSKQQKQKRQAMSKQLTDRQNLIEECGGSEFIQAIFKQHVNFNGELQLLNQILLFGIAYLFEGNRQCQQSMRRVLSQDRDNLMLLNIRDLILQIGIILIQMRRIREGVNKRSFNYPLADTYDYLNSQTCLLENAFGPDSFDKSEMRAEKQNQLALCRIFRFLQLFCQNGNIAMKKFLLEQTNDLAGLQKKANSVNFIETTTLLLRKLFKVMNDKLVNIPQRLLDFINEITQLPCISNQMAFMKSTFFQDISYLADFFSNETNLQARKFSITVQNEDEGYIALQNIYQKGVDLALCNFQGNDNKLLTQFLGKCQPKFLWMVIRQNLIKILTETSQQIFVIKNDSDKISDFHAGLLKEFNLYAIQQYIKKKQGEESQLSENIQNILAVLYILKKIEVYKDVMYEAAFVDKDHPNLIQKEKADIAQAFRKDLIEYAKKQGGYQHIQDFLDQFGNLILSIEVSSFNGQSKGLQFIYFPKHPIFNYLAGDTRDNIMMRVIRGTQRDKLISLLKQRQAVYQQISLNYRLKYQPQKLPIIDTTISITSQYAAQTRKIARLISFFICFLMLFFIIVDHDTEDMVSTFTYTTSISQIIIRAAAAAQLLVTLWFIFIWVKLREPLATKKMQLDQEEGQKAGDENQKKSETRQKQIDQIQGWDIVLLHYKQTITRVKPLWTNFKSLVKNTIIIRILRSVYALSQYQSGFLSLVMFVIAAILGNFVGVEWYTLHLFDIFTDISQLTNIFKAILNNFKKLALLSFLAGVFILVFNVISLNTYTYVLWSDDHPDSACEDIVGCVLSLYTGGVIGQSMDSFDAWRFSFDTIYVVFMQMLFQQIVGGIMIDAFSQLKEQDSERDEDKKNKCYICGMDKPTMERTGSTFQKHTQKHLLWNYLYYLYVLSKKGKTDYTGLQYEIDLKISQEDVQWFPALGQGDTEGQVEKVFVQLQSSIDWILNSVDESISRSDSHLKHVEQVYNKIKELST